MSRLPKFPQRGLKDVRLFELPPDAPELLKNWIGKIRFTDQMVKWFSLIELVQSELPEPSSISTQSDDNGNSQIGSPPSQRSWSDFVMRQAGGIIKLEGETALFPGITRNGLNTKSTLADGSAATGHEVEDDAYDATTWNGNLEVPTKNAIRDWIVSFGSNYGTYTPGLTSVNNVTSLSTGTSFFVQIGSIVFAAGHMFVEPTLVATQTQVGIDLPVASNLSTSTDAAGVSSTEIVTESGIILADAGNNRAELDFISVDITLHAIRYAFAYLVI